MQSRREELLDLQRSLLGFDAIAEAEGLQPTEEEIEVRGGIDPPAWGAPALQLIRPRPTHAAGAGPALPGLLPTCLACHGPKQGML